MKTSLMDFRERCIITLGLICIWRILSFIPVPGINYRQLFFNFNADFLSTIGRGFSFFGLGLAPYLGAYIFVELLSLVLPPLKSWRLEGQTGRLKLKKVTYLITFFNCLINGYLCAILLEKMKGPVKGLVSRPGFMFRIQYTTIVTLGTFLILLIAYFITKRGIGHGISILLFTGYLTDRFRFISAFKNNLFLGTSLTILTIIILVIVIIYFEKSHNNIPINFENSLRPYLPLKLTTAGIVPEVFAMSLIIFSVMLLRFLNEKNLLLNWIIKNFSPGGICHFIASFILIFIMYFILTACFHDPNEIVNFLKKRNAALVIPDREEGGKYIDRRLEIMASLGALYLNFIVLLPILTNQFFGLYFSGTKLIAIVVITLDIIEEACIRIQFGRCKKIAEFHNMSLVGVFKSLLECNEIPCCLQGYYHRTLFYFFGPFIEVSVLVPERMVEEANKLIEKYEFSLFRVNASTKKEPELEEVKKGGNESIIKISERSFRYPDIYCRCGKRMKAVFENDGPIHQKNVHFACDDYFSACRKHDLFILDEITEEEAKIINQEIIEEDR